MSDFHLAVGSVSVSHQHVGVGHSQVVTSAKGAATEVSYVSDDGEPVTVGFDRVDAARVVRGRQAEDANLRLVIRDDGIGGADAAKGSGLTGLVDRVEALGGTMAIASHARSGTSLLVKIPLDVQ